MRVFCSKWIRRLAVTTVLVVGPSACQVREADLPVQNPPEEENFFVLSTPLSEVRNDYHVAIHLGVTRPDRIIKEWTAKDASGRPVMHSSPLTPEPGKNPIFDAKVVPGQTYTYTPSKKGDEAAFRPEKMDVEIPNDLLVSLDTVAESFENDHPIHGFNSNRRMYMKPGEKIQWPAGQLVLATNRMYFDHHYAKDIAANPESSSEVLLSRVEKLLENRVKEIRPKNLANLEKIYKSATDFQLSVREARGKLKVHIDPSFTKEHPVSVNVSVYDPRQFSLEITSDAPSEAFKMQWINLGSQAFLIERDGLVPVQAHAGLYRRKAAGDGAFKLVTYTGQYYVFDGAESGNAVHRGSEPLRNPLQLPGQDFEKIDIENPPADVPQTLLESARMNQRCFELSQQFEKEGLTVVLRASGEKPFTVNQIKFLEKVSREPHEFMKLMKESETTELEVSNEKNSVHPTVKNIRISIDLGISSDIEQEFQIALDRLRKAIF